MYEHDVIDIVVCIFCFRCIWKNNVYTTKFRLIFEIVPNTKPTSLV